MKQQYKAPAKLALEGSRQIPARRGRLTEQEALEINMLFTKGFHASQKTGHPKVFGKAPDMWILDCTYVIGSVLASEMRLDYVDTGKPEHARLLKMAESNVKKAIGNIGAEVTVPELKRSISWSLERNAGYQHESSLVLESKAPLPVDRINTAFRILAVNPNPADVKLQKVRRAIKMSIKAMDLKIPASREDGTVLMTMIGMIIHAKGVAGNIKDNIESAIREAVHPRVPQPSRIELKSRLI